MLEVGWCSDHGLPHSALLEWEHEDRAKLVAYLTEANQRCGSCGTAAWEWDPDKGGRTDAYEAGIHRCWGCYHREGIARDGELGPGDRATLIPVEVARRQER